MSEGENKLRSAFISSLSQVKPPALAPIPLQQLQGSGQQSQLFITAALASVLLQNQVLHLGYWHFPYHNESPFNWYLDNLCDLPTTPLSPKQFRAVSAEVYWYACR